MLDVGRIRSPPDDSVNVSVREVDAGIFESTRLFLMEAICCTKGPMPMDMTVMMAPIAADRLRHVNLYHILYSGRGNTLHPGIPQESRTPQWPSAGPVI